MTMPKLRIVLADDHETVREGLKAILNSQSDMEVISEAADGQSAVDQASKLHPDVVIMDVSMPQMNGLRATEAIRHTCPTVKVLTLTRHADDGYLQQLLRAGASGYVLKQSRTADVLHAIRAVATGGTYVDPSLAGRMVGKLGMRGQTSARGRGTLSGREEEILRLVAWGYSNKEIAGRLDLSVKTVETHKANAAQKLGLTNRIAIVRYALLQGWLHDS
jgi:DNA-binding NarL/FixJ family response regulator